MCGIVGAVSSRNIVPVLVQGLQRLEYRGYDSCGVAVHADGLHARAHHLAGGRPAGAGARRPDRGRHRHRPHALGHARRAGGAQRASAFQPRPGRRCARPRRPGRVALVHNGIIENHETLRAALQAKGYVFASQTDTEVIAHLIDSHYDGDLFEAVKASGEAAARRLCDRGVLPRRAAARGRRARGLAADAGRGPGRRRELPGQRRDGAGRRDRPDRLPGRGRRGRPAAGQVLDRRPARTSR